MLRTGLDENHSMRSTYLGHAFVTYPGMQMPLLLGHAPYSQDLRLEVWPLTMGPKAFHGPSRVIIGYIIDTYRFRYIDKDSMVKVPLLGAYGFNPRAKFWVRLLPPLINSWIIFIVYFMYSP